jgi:hypothetical protein
MRTGDLRDVGAGLALLTSRTDFVLWLYFMFTIANSMIPSVTTSFSLRPLLIVLVLFIAGLSAAGVINDVAAVINTAAVDLVNTLSAVFGATVALNGVVTLVLALIENTIEAITGDSAYFENGRLIAKRREEIQAERRTAHQRARRAREQAKRRVPGPLEGIPSIYRLSLPIPKAAELASGPARLIVEPAKPDVLPPPRRSDPDVIAFGDEPEPEIVPAPPRSAPAMPPPLLLGADSADVEADDLYDALLDEAEPESDEGDDSEPLDA